MRNTGNKTYFNGQDINAAKFLSNLHMTSRLMGKRLNHFTGVVRIWKSKLLQGSRFLFGWCFTTNLNDGQPVQEGLANSKHLSLMQKRLCVSGTHFATCCYMQQITQAVHQRLIANKPPCPFYLNANFHHTITGTSILMYRKQLEIQRVSSLGGREDAPGILEVNAGATQILK